MSLVQGFEVLAVLALAVAIATGVGLFFVYRRLQRYQRNQHVIMGSRGTVDIVEHVAALDDKLANMRVALEDLTMIARDHDVRIDSGLSRVGVVRFDAYQDLGGRQSTAVAFLNSLGNGVVITTVVSRDFARMYVKLLKDGSARHPPRPRRGRRPSSRPGASGPFTIRPRVEPAPATAVTGAAALRRGRPDAEAAVVWRSDRGTAAANGTGGGPRESSAPAAGLPPVVER